MANQSSDKRSDRQQQLTDSGQANDVIVRLEELEDDLEQSNNYLPEDEKKIRSELANIQSHLQDTLDKFDEFRSNAANSSEDAKDLARREQFLDGLNKLANIDFGNDLQAGLEAFRAQYTQALQHAPPSLNLQPAPSMAPSAPTNAPTPAMPPAMAAQGFTPTGGGIPAGGGGSSTVATPPQTQQKGRGDQDSSD